MNKKTYFQDQVLSRLFGDPGSPKKEDKNERVAFPQNIDLEALVKDVNTHSPNQQKLYTAAPPPSDWKAELKTDIDKEATHSPPSSSEDDSSESPDEGNLLPRKRHRRRGKRLKLNPQEKLKSSEKSEKKDTLEKLCQETHTSDTVVDVKLTKNRKRKLKKKRREKMKQSTEQENSKEFVFEGHLT